MKIAAADFDYEYPEELIASCPAEPRDSSRLMVVDRATGACQHRLFKDLPEYLKPGDCVVLNRTKVLSCRLIGRKSTGGKVDLLLVGQREPGVWTALSSGLKAGMILNFPGNANASVEGLTPEGEYILRFDRNDLLDYLDVHGAAPLPPYIAKRKISGPEDVSRYQTVYARDKGSIAAPTAGLHFTDALLKTLEDKGIALARLTLHVGRGTFRPIQAEDAAEHVMLPEWYRLEADQAALILRARSAGGRVISVGTTSTRVLETLAARPQGITTAEGETKLYIYPGYEFRAIDGLITNFHLPRSTPLMLASAFVGREQLLAAYSEALSRRYRLFSFGDAMLAV